MLRRKLAYLLLGFLLIKGVLVWSPPSFFALSFLFYFFILYILGLLLVSTLATPILAKKEKKIL